MDLMVSDDVWKQIKPLGKPEGAGLLCPSCIVVRIEKVYGYTAMKADFIGRQLNCFGIGAERIINEN